ncbi:hypothetical protein BDV37DRAFT_19466 [Aspergillus pseudonomiae]|uniref:Uncharacterized protein n=1 Tax=Aspergillus pseudonomiae TaxID=1506151 RepID=A0A5N7CZ65_9EURO|nr:uncharacterized protein BDV37DRAFT_19466 [Aspergillus pseudonomiae]KAE8398838.1 hypothetical protein BDV37DRAFT_19466 [Aspergillus pseudonomiae]
MIGCDRIHRQSSAEVVLVCSFVMLGPLCCPLFLGLVVSYARVALPLHFAIYHPIVLPAILFATAVVYCVSLRKMWLRRLCSGLLHSATERSCVSIFGFPL